MKHVIKKILGLFLIVVTLSFGAVLRIIYCSVDSWTQRKFYRPEILLKKQHEYTTLIEQHDAKEISFETEDGVHLAALLIERPQAQRVWIICHGYHQTKESMRAFATLLPKDSLLLLDLRTHGMSEGDRISLGAQEYKDIFAAVAFLKNNPATSTLPIIGLGVSMGAATLIKAVYKGADINALILDCVFASLDQQMKRAFVAKSKLPLFMYPCARYIFEWLTKEKVKNLEPVAMIKKITIPVFIIQSQADRIVLPEDAQALYQHVPHQQLWITPANRHCRSFQTFPHEYMQQVNNFLTNSVVLLQ